MIGGELIHGQIASFIDTLHLSYLEVWEVIPYQNLIMMQQNKIHEASGDVIKKTTSADLFGDKIKK